MLIDVLSFLMIQRWMYWVRKKIPYLGGICLGVFSNKKAISKQKWLLKAAYTEGAMLMSEEVKTYCIVHSKNQLPTALDQ